MNAYMELATDWMIRMVVRVWMWIKRANTIRCKDCKQEVQIEMLRYFVDAGCGQCGSTRLEAVRE